MSTLQLPGPDDTVVLVTPPTTVVDTRIFLYGHRLYTVPLHTRRLREWLRGRCKQVAHIDCLGDPESGALPLGTRTAGPRSNRPEQVRCFAYGLEDEHLSRKLTEIDRPSQVWVTTLFAYDRNLIGRTIATIKKTLPDVPVVVGGSYASLAPVDCRELGADIVHQGLLDAAEDAGPSMIGPFGFVVAGRGCPNRCSYCAFSYIEGRRALSYDPDRVLAQVDSLAGDGMAALALYSPAIFRGPLAEPSERIVEGLAQLDAGVVGWAGFEPKIVNRRRAELLHRAGFVDLTVPIQTLDRDLARQWGRRETLEDFERALETLVAAGFSRLELSSDVIMGHPDQTLEETVRAMCYVWSLGITPAVFPYTWIPHSADAERLHVDLAATPAESFQPYLFPFAGPDRAARDYVELAKLSRILPQLVEAALGYLDPDGDVPRLIAHYLDELGFDVPQWKLDVELPLPRTGYATYMSHPWELALALSDRSREGLPAWLAEACRRVRVCDPKYAPIERQINSGADDRPSAGTP